MIHTSDAWDTRVIHETHEGTKGILAIPYRKHAMYICLGWGAGRGVVILCASKVIVSLCLGNSGTGLGTSHAAVELQKKRVGHKCDTRS